MIQWTLIQESYVHHIRHDNSTCALMYPCHGLQPCNNLPPFYLKPCSSEPFCNSDVDATASILTWWIRSKKLGVQRSRIGGRGQGEVGSAGHEIPHHPRTAGPFTPPEADPWTQVGGGASLGRDERVLHPIRLLGEEGGVYKVVWHLYLARNGFHAHNVGGLGLDHKSLTEFGRLKVM